MIVGLQRAILTRPIRRKLRFPTWVAQHARIVYAALSSPLLPRRQEPHCIRQNARLELGSKLPIEREQRDLEAQCGQIPGGTRRKPGLEIADAVLDPVHLRHRRTALVCRCEARFGSAMIAAGIIAPGLFQRGPGRQELRINLVVSTFPGAASLHQIREIRQRQTIHSLCRNIIQAAIVDFRFLHRPPMVTG